VLSASQSDYFYGVDALSTEDVIISGFYDSTQTYGVYRWSHDGGKTWTDDLSFGRHGCSGFVTPTRKTG